MTSVAPKIPEVANSTKDLPTQFCPTTVGTPSKFMEMLEGEVTIVLAIGVELVVCSEDTSNALSGLRSTCRIWYWFVFSRIMTLTLIKLDYSWREGHFRLRCKRC